MNYFTDLPSKLGTALPLTTLLIPSQPSKCTKMHFLLFVPKAKCSLNVMMIKLIAFLVTFTYDKVVNILGLFQVVILTVALMATSALGDRW